MDLKKDGSALKAFCGIRGTEKFNTDYKDPQKASHSIERLMITALTNVYIGNPIFTKFAKRLLPIKMIATLLI